MSLISMEFKQPEDDGLPAWEHMEAIRAFALARGLEINVARVCPDEDSEQSE